MRVYMLVSVVSLALCLHRRHRTNGETKAKYEKMAMAAPSTEFQPDLELDRLADVNYLAPHRK